MAQDFSPQLAGEKDQKFGKYTLKECLGNGGEAEVWKAIDTATQEIVAIRILRKLKNTEDIRRHFEAEIQKLQLLARHDHIISLWDSGWDHELPYLVMPYIPDGSLAHWLADLNTKDQRIPFSEALIYIKQTIDALIYVHSHNIIHRDVKPSNLLRGEHGILLNDWGIALNAEAPDPLTRANIGSPPYRPPEQEQGHPVPASDQYAMAVTSCELITGKWPNNGGHEILQTLHPQIAKVLSRARDADPAKRFHSMQDFSSALNNAALSEVLAGSTLPMPNPVNPPLGPIAPRPNRVPPEPPLLRWLIIGAVVLVLSSLIVGVFTLLRPTTPITLCLATDLPEHGAEAASGQGVSRGVQLALSQTFATSYKGYSIVRSDMDDSSENEGGAPDPAKGANNIEDLFSSSAPSASCPNPIAIIGPSDSSVAVEEIPVAAENHVLLLTPSSTAPCLTLANYSAPPSCTYNIVHPQEFVNTFGRLPSTDINQGYTIADFLWHAGPPPHGLGARKIVIVEDEEVYGSQIAQAVIDRLMQQGITPSELEIDCVKPDAEFNLNPSCVFSRSQNAHPFSLSTIGVLATQIKQEKEKPDAIFFAGQDNRGASLLRQQLGDSIPFIGGDALVDEKITFFGTIGSHAANIFATFPAPDPSTFTSTSAAASEATFYSLYQNKFGSPPAPYSANGYDAANIILQTIKNMIDAGQSITPGNVAKAVLDNDLGKDDFVSVTGSSIHFNGDGDNVGPQLYTIYQSEQQPSDSSWDWHPLTIQTAD